MKRTNRIRKVKAILFILLFFLLIVIVGYVMLSMGAFNVKYIEVKGNKQFTDDEISTHILEDKYCQYAPYLYLKYKLFKPKIMPFVADMNIELTGLNKVRVEVEEKPIVAYAEHLDSHIFFDCDGIIVESSNRTIPGLVRIDGLNFKSYKLYERPELDNPVILDSLNGIVRIMNKYKLKPDSLYVNKRGEIDLKFGFLTVKLGMEEALDEKISKVASIIPKLNEQRGILKLNAYRKSGDSIIYIDYNKQRKG